MSAADVRTPAARVESSLTAAGCNPRRRGERIEALCPAHDDSKPSLSLTSGHTGTALVTCHAGCSLESILDALHLTKSDLFPEPPPKKEIVAAYSYRDEAGKLLFEKVRYLPKGFRQRRPDGAGGWDWSLNGTRRVLYRLPETLAAVERGEVVYVVEGEKDVEAIVKHGGAATCNPEGGGRGKGKWRPEYSETLRGACVVVVADADTEGREHARHVAESLDGVASSVVVVEAAAGKDAFDHLGAGHGLQDFVPTDVGPHDPGRDVGPHPGHRAVPGAEPKVWPATDLGNARRLVAEHGHDLRFAPQLGSFLTWDGRRWVEDITGEAERRAKATVDGMLTEAGTLGGDDRSEMLKHYTRSSSAGRLRAMQELARTEPAVPITVDQLDADPYVLNVSNGTIDLRSGELLQHDRDMLMTRLAAAEYDPDAAAPAWERFVREVFDDDDELVTFVQRFAGYSLTGDVGEQMMVFAHGGGANGKSTLLNALRAVAGDYGLHLDPRLLTVAQHEEHPTGLTDLRGARLVTTIETEAGRQLAEALVKTLTGGDPIRARRMRCDYFEFLPSHKLWFAGNHLPRVKGNDHGIWRRIAVVPFEVTFAGATEDKSLPDKLKAERSGILSWMVRGCLEWQQSGLAVPDRVRKATSEYRESEDHLGRFLADCTVTGDNCVVSAKTLRESYEVWCAALGERVWSSTAVGRELSSRGFDSAQVGASRTRSWLGIGLLAEEREREHEQV